MIDDDDDDWSIIVNASWGIGDAAAEEHQWELFTLHFERACWQQYEIFPPKLDSVWMISSYTCSQLSLHVLD